MDAIRVDICSYTASFRIPGFMGYQTTSRVPPPSTVYGLMAAAAGREISPEETWVAYRFEYEAWAQDLEKIISFSEKGPRWYAKLNAVNTFPVTREFLFRTRLILFLQPGAAAEAFLRPRYPLLLGRSQDVAYVDHFTTDYLRPAEDRQTLSGVLIPFPAKNLPSRIASFPTFYPLAERRARAVKPFHVVDCQSPVKNASISGFPVSILCSKINPDLVVPLFDSVILS